MAPWVVAQGNWRTPARGEVVKNTSLQVGLVVGVFAALAGGVFLLGFLT